MGHRCACPSATTCFQLLLLVVSCNNLVEAFGICPVSLQSSTYTLTTLSSTPPRLPRRNLKKRKGRERKKIPADRNQKGEIWTNNAEIEVRPLVASRRKEAGQDFWIDPKDLEREKEWQFAMANRKSMEGEMPKEKLKTELAAPYTQNWIGLMSMLVVILATIIKNTPEILEYPTISIPDLVAGDPIPLQSTLSSMGASAAEAIQSSGQP